VLPVLADVLEILDTFGATNPPLLFTLVLVFSAAGDEDDVDDTKNSLGGACLLLPLLLEPQQLIFLICLRKNRERRFFRVKSTYRFVFILASNVYWAFGRKGL
jgi:hypothetical protein